MARKGRAEHIKERGATSVTFSLVDESTVKRLKKDGVVKVPSKKISIPKDKRWNEKKIGSKVLQGIENGDSVASIAKSLSEVVDNNISSAFRNARTMTTSAENNGRLDSYKDLQDQGVVQKKVWIATADDRTRAEHLDMDGEEVDIDEPFSNGLMFPGDGDGDPEEVWNCRCTMEDRIVGFMDEEGNIDYIDEGLREDDTDHGEQIAEEKERRGQSEPERRPDVEVTRESASDDWFEYEYAEAMSEYVETGVMPENGMSGNVFSAEKREELRKEAELIQKEAASTKTEYKTLYRGMVLDEQEARAMFTPGQTYEFETLTATATSKDIASIYTNVENAYIDNPVSVIIEIQKPDGIYGFVRDGSEVVLPKGSEFKIARNYMDKNGTVHISLYSKKGKNIRL